MTMTVSPVPVAAPAEPEERSIYEAIGGRPVLSAAVDIFYGRLLADPTLSPLSLTRRYRSPGVPGATG